MSKLQKIPIFGALSGLIKEDLVEPTIDRFLRSVRGYGALGDLPTPTKGVLDPAEMGGVKLPTFVEDITFTKTESGLAVPEKKIKIEEEPQELERYTDIMASDFEKKSGPFLIKLKLEKN